MRGFAREWGSEKQVHDGWLTTHAVREPLSADKVGNLDQLSRIMAHSIRLTRIVGRVNEITAHLQGLHFSSMGIPAEAWQPAVNVYAYADRIEVCVDLAGVSTEDVEIRVEGRRLVVRGRRSPPELRRERPPCGRILAMEIQDGAFERVLEFPVEVNAEQAQARQDNGWLWIVLPRTGG